MRLEFLHSSIALHPVETGDSGRAFELIPQTLRFQLAQCFRRRTTTRKPISRRSPKLFGSDDLATHGLRTSNEKLIDTSK